MIDSIAPVLGPIFWQMIGLLVLAMAVRIGMEYLEARLRRKRRLEKALKHPFSERMKELTETLTRASSEVDRALEEMAMVSQVREAAISSMEKRLANMADSERQLKARLEAMEKVSHPVAEHFAALVERASAKGERRSAWRDYILFGLGVVVSTIVTVIMKTFGL